MGGGLNYHEAARSRVGRHLKGSIVNRSGIVWSRWVLPVASLGLLLAASAILLARMASALPAPAPAVATGPAIPDFTLPDLTGTSVRFSSFVGGRPAVVSFGTTTCPYCNVQLEQFKRLQRQTRDRVAILEINVGEAPERVAAHVAKLGSPFTTLLDRTGAVYGRYGTGAVPVTLVIDARGQILERGSVIETARILKLLKLDGSGA